MQKTLSQEQRSSHPPSPPPPPPTGIALQKAMLRWLENRARATADDIKTAFNQNTPEGLAETLRILKRMGKITLVEEEGVPKFVGAKCETCQSLKGACVRRQPPPKHGWACNLFAKRNWEIKNKDTRDRDSEHEFDKDQWFERLMGR